MLARFVLLALLAFACSSESVNEAPGSGGASAGSGGASAGSGGSVTGGAAGSAGSTGGAVAGGTGGGGGVDAGIEAGGAGGSVSCGNKTCSLASSYCCFGAGTATCAAAGSECDNADFLCDGSEDCPASQVCCHWVMVTPPDAGGAAKSGARCQSACSNTFPKELQICKKTAECMKGSCQPTSSPSFPPDYSTCQ